MFERFTESARRALFFARYEVSETGSRELRPEHLLLGLIREPEGLVTGIAAQAGVSFETIRRDIVQALGHGEKVPTSVEVAFSADAQRVAFNGIFHPIAERLLAHCDGVLRVGGASHGADLMVTIARKRGLPVYQRLREIPGCESCDL